MLAHCSEVSNRFAIFDTIRASLSDSTEKAIANFRAGIGVANLSYGAAYYPWLKTTVFAADQDNIDPASDILVAMTMDDLTKDPAYFTLLNIINDKGNILPPGGAIAGVYAMVDYTRGVWKAPADVSLNAVIAPFVNLTDAQQAVMNIDASTGKSVNAIRAFSGKGVLVWGARTLAGNDNEWRYISVRRTILMLEESIKLAIAQYVFEPNVANTWVKTKVMIENYLNTLWRDGALVGAKPEQAFAVKVGLGETMTALDILDGFLKVAVMVALIRPAEFIVITLQQKMGQN